MAPSSATRRALGRAAAGVLALAWVCAAGGGKVAINTVGFTPDAPKLATIDYKHCDAKTQWKVMRTGYSHGDAAVLEGLATPLKGHDGMCEVDFSALTQTGNFTLVVVDIGVSPPFEVSPVAVNRVFRMAMEGFWLARCGMDVPPLPESSDIVTTSTSGTKFHHGICHTDDGWIDGKHTHEDVPEGERFKNGTGGWHDAGDYGKYSVNTGFTLGVLMLAWEHFGSSIGCADLGLAGVRHAHGSTPRPDFSSGSKIPDYLDETRWGMAWLLKMQKDDGTVYHKLTPSHFASFGDTPDQDDSKRYYSPWSTSATANVASTGAQCARVFRGHDSSLANACLEKAKLAWQALEAHPEEVKPDLSAFGTGTYVMFDNPEWDKGCRIWAAMELYETTGDTKYLHAGEALIRELDRPASECAGMPQPSGCKVADQLDWDEQRNLGMLRYALLSDSRAHNRDGDLYRQVVESFKAVSSGMVSRSQRDPFHNTLGGFTKWGVNGETVRQTIVLHATELIVGHNKTLEDAAFSQLSHVLGMNRYQRSYVTHLGHDPPHHPHHRPSMVYKDPWPGYLVGGPNSGWKDAWLAFRSNEVAINWNCGLAYASARYFKCSGSRGGRSYSYGSGGGAVPAAGPDSGNGPPGSPDVDMRHGHHHGHHHKKDDDDDDNDDDTIIVEGHGHGGHHGGHHHKKDDHNDDNDDDTVIVYEGHGHGRHHGGHHHKKDDDDDNDDDDIIYVEDDQVKFRVSSDADGADAGEPSKREAKRAARHARHAAKRERKAHKHDDDEN